MMSRWARTIWYVLTLRCEEAGRLRDVSERSELTRAERFGEYMHTALCSSCRRTRKQLGLLRDAIGDIAAAETDASVAGVGPTLDEGARERIARALRQDSAE